MEANLFLLLGIIFLALGFDFVNGFHDTANAIATTVSTKALKLKTAIVLAALMNFMGALVFTKVAKAIAENIVNPFNLENGLGVLLVALLVAISWNLITWLYALPSSSSHALIGALVGAVFSSAGVNGINIEGLFIIVKFLLIFPWISFILGYFVMVFLDALFLKRYFLREDKLNHYFKKFQIIIALWQAFGHGANDAQKSMGIITLALVVGGAYSSMEIPLWVKLSCALAIAFGTSVGGFKIIKTVGSKITKLEPASGLASDFTSAGLIFGATLWSLPVSTSQVLSSAIIGVGCKNGFSRVNWKISFKIILVGLITLPLNIFLGGLIYKLLF